MMRYLGLLVESLHWSSIVLDANDHWVRELKEGHDICTVFLDYSKAFNTFIAYPAKLQNYVYQ